VLLSVVPIRSGTLPSFCHMLFQIFMTCLSSPTTRLHPPIFFAFSGEQISCGIL
jgi:hypothetical protein